MIDSFLIIIIFIVLKNSFANLWTSCAMNFVSSVVHPVNVVRKKNILKNNFIRVNLLRIQLPLVKLVTWPLSGTVFNQWLTWRLRNRRLINRHLAYRTFV
jgi:hypothetical protein